MRKHNRLRALRLYVTGAVSTLVLLGLAPVGASSANLSHSYQASGSIPLGSIVSLDTKKSDFVQMANPTNANRVLGVTVATDDSLLAVDPDDNKVQVATSGNVDALVSDLNGSINVGDQIAVSPFNGVGMKAEVGSHILGLAQTSLKSTSDGATKQTVKDKDGKSKEVLVGYVRLSISVGADTIAATSVKLNSLQKIAKSLTGKTISTVRVLISLGVGIVALIALITLIYASIYGSIISVGRNPLAKYAIFRTLGSVLAMAALTALLAGLTIFFLLR